MKVLSIIIVINVLMLLGFVSGSQKNTRIQQKQTSENEYDTAQLVSKLRSYSKRILYAFRLWILHLTEFSTICPFITLAIGLAFLGFIMNLWCAKRMRRFTEKSIIIQTGQNWTENWRKNSKNLGKIKDCKKEENSNLLSMKSKIINWSDLD